MSFRRRAPSGPRAAAPDQPPLRRLAGLGAALRGTTALADRPLRAAALAALAVNLIAYVYVWSALPALPELMPLHYNGAGVVDTIGRPAELFKLPGIATGILLLNALLAALLHRRERPAAHILVWGALIAQGVFASGAWVLVSKAAGE